MNNPEPPQAIPPATSPDSAHVVPLAYSVEVAARVVGVGRTSMFAEIKAGRLKAVKLGRRTIVAAADLEDWLRRARAGR